jgi:hypothetical protein
MIAAALSRWILGRQPFRQYRTVLYETPACSAIARVRHPL